MLHGLNLKFLSEDLTDWNGMLPQISRVPLAILGSDQSGIYIMALPAKLKKSSQPSLSDIFTRVMERLRYMELLEDKIGFRRIGFDWSVNIFCNYFTNNLK